MLITLQVIRYLNVTKTIGLGAKRYMAVLTIRLLGTPEIFIGDQALPFRTRKMLALLVYLLVERGMHGRESLMALLWPESSSSSAAGSLRVTMSRLRQTLQEAGDVLITKAGKVGFDFAALGDLDLDWLETAVQTETPPEQLRAILSLDRGEFLEGFSLPDAPGFDTWVTIQREAYQRQVEAVYDRLSQHLLAINDTAAAVETCARWVARAPLSEQAYRRSHGCAGSERPARRRAANLRRSCRSPAAGTGP